MLPTQESHFWVLERRAEAEEGFEFLHSVFLLLLLLAEDLLQLPQTQADGFECLLPAFVTVILVHQHSLALVVLPVRGSAVTMVLDLLEEHRPFLCLAVREAKGM